MRLKNACLITGASGSLGSAVALGFLQAGYRLYGVDIVRPPYPEWWHGFFEGRVEDSDLSMLIAGDIPSVICHLAGGASVPASVESPYDDFGLLLPGTLKLLCWNGRDGPRARILFFSSAAVYGDPESLPIKEDSRLQPVSPYGIHKAAGEMMVSAYGSLYEFETICLRLFSAYGPGLRKQVVWDIANKAYTAQKSCQTIELIGTGLETRDFVFIEDIALMAVELGSYDLSKPNIVLNIASGKETKIMELANLVIRKLGLKVDVNFSNVLRSGDPARWCGDVAALQASGCFRERPLPDGLDQFTVWFKSLAAA